MPITVAFTTTALVALVFNTWFMTKAIRQKQALTESGENGKLRIIANTFIQVWTAIILVDLLIIISGLGILTGHRELGYLLATVPIGSVFIGVFAIRGF